MAATLSQSRAIAGALSPMPIARILRAYCLEAKFETLQALRTPAFVIPFTLLPVGFYLLIGVLLVPEASGELGPGIVNYIFSGMAVYSVCGPGIFGGCLYLPLEREGGVLKFKRAVPMPPAANLVGKAVMTMLFSAVALTLVFAVALVVGRITLSGVQLAIIWAVMVAGVVPFFAIGLFIGAYTSGNAAPAITNLVFIPMLMLSGLFMPLPEFMKPWIPIWPSFHLDQVALGLAGVDEFVFFPTHWSAGMLVGVTVLFGGLAIRRIARAG